MANFVVSGTPHVRSKESIQSIMRDVIIALVPATAAGIYYFGLRALILIVAAIISAVFFEWLYHKKTCYNQRPVRSCNRSVTGNEPSCICSRMGCNRR